MSNFGLKRQLEDFRDSTYSDKHEIIRGCISFMKGGQNS